MASPYTLLYKTSKYALTPYKSPTESRAWYELSPVEQMRELRGKQEKLAGYPILPPERKSFRERIQPALSILQIIGGILNVPSASISGAFKQIVDGSPGFDAQEYFRDVFHFKEQVSWRDVIGMVAEKDNRTDMWDNKWAQIGFGLTLDIILDPLTYFGVGPWTKLNKVQVDDAMRAVGKIAKSKAGMLGPDEALKVNRAIMNAQKKLTRGFGWQLPFSRKVSPFKGKKMMGVVEDITDIKPGMLAQVDYDMIVGPRLWDIASKKTFSQTVDNFLARWAPGYKVLRKALNPKANRLEEVFWKKAEMLNAVGQDMEPLVRQLNYVQRKWGTETLEAVLKHMEAPPFVDAKTVDLLANRANLMSKLFVDLKQGKRVVPEVVGALEKAQKVYDNNVTGNIIKALKKIESQKLLKVGPKIDPSPKWLMEQAGEIYSSYNAHKMMQFINEAGLPFEDLTGLAKYVPEEVPFEKAFPKIFKEMTGEQQKHFSQVIDFARDTLDDWYRAEIKAGLPVDYRAMYVPGAKPGYRGVGAAPELGSPHPYFTRHRVTDETASATLDYLAHQLHTTGQARSIEKAKRLLKAGKAEGYPRISTSITDALYHRGTAHFKAMHRQKFIEDIKQFGVNMGEEMLPHHRAIEGVPELAGYLFDTDTAKYIGRTVQAIGRDDAINAFVKGFDGIQGWWKILVTSVNPGFHLRNAYSNHFLGWIRWGTRYMKPKTHRMALKIVAYEFYKKDKQYLAKFGKAVDVDDIMKGMDALVPGTKITLEEAGRTLKLEGVIRKQFRMPEVARKKELIVGGSFAKKMMKKLNIAGKESVLADFGEAAGSLIESQARVAAWITDVADTGDAIRSARTVQEVFVNYANLTEFEAQIGRRVIPFWSWMKQNTANQVKFVFTQPGRYAKIARVAQAVEAGAPRKIEEKYKPEYYKDLWMWQLPITLPDGTALFFNPNFPFQDLNRVAPGRMWESLLTSVTPFLKTPVEMITGYDVFRKGPIEKYPGYKAPIPGILQNIAKLLPENIKRKLNIEVDNRGQLTMNPKVAHAISNLAPFIKNTSRLLMQEPSMSDADRYFKWVSYVWGIKIKPLDELTRQYYYTLDELQKRKKRMRELGIEY